MSELDIPVERPHGLSDILAHYGDPKIRMVQGVWIVDPAWESANLTMLYHSALPHPADAEVGRIYVHRYVVDPLRRLLNRWAARRAAGDQYQILHMGAFAPRAQRGSVSLPSTHSWAIAFDLNPETNPLVVCELDDSRRQGGRDIPDGWIDDAKAEGWFWGGEFQHRYDPMHFQLCDGY